MPVVVAACSQPYSDPCLVLLSVYALSYACHLTYLHLSGIYMKGRECSLKCSCISGETNHPALKVKKLHCATFWTNISQV